MNASHSDRAASTRPPLPRAMFKVVNPMMKALLRSPLHRLLSARLLVISWRGRKSGRLYSTPVGYQRQGRDIVIFLHGDWYRNFQGEGAPVSLRVQGKDVRGIARASSDPEIARQVMRQFVEAYGPATARRMGFAPPAADAPAETWRHAASGTHFVVITPDGIG